MMHWSPSSGSPSEAMVLSIKPPGLLLRTPGACPWLPLHQLRPGFGSRSPPHPGEQPGRPMRTTLGRLVPQREEECEEQIGYQDQGGAGGDGAKDKSRGCWMRMSSSHLYQKGLPLRCWLGRRTVKSGCALTTGARKCDPDS